MKNITSDRIEKTLWQLWELFDNNWYNKQFATKNPSYHTLTPNDEPQYFLTDWAMEFWERSTQRICKVADFHDIDGEWILSEIGQPFEEY